ncbi:MAG TPA: aminoglycoside adenylyltransferase domain-containing protein [Herpetosiphonaceae bacterium]
MADHILHPTPYPDINAVLHLLLSSAQTILKHDFLGMYLCGSLASGDFNRQSSDIDFVIVTADELSDKVIAALAAMHDRIAASGPRWAKKLEGSYIPQRLLRRYDPSYERYPSINERRFYVGGHGSDWVIQRQIMREHGIVVAGPDPQLLIDPVGPDDLRRAVLATLREWWSQLLDDPARLHSREYQVFAVLTMCRALYTLQHGSLASKPVAARWARQTLGEPWSAMIERALAWPCNPQPDHLSETLDFIRYTLEGTEQRTENKL